MLLDRPDCGLSDAPDHQLDAASLARLGDTLVVDVLDALELEAAHLVATSLGGSVALRTAVAHPERLGRMVQFNWPVGAPRARLPAFMRAMGLVPGRERLAGLLPPGERTVRAMFRRIGLRHALEQGLVSQEVHDCSVALLRDTDTLRNELPATRTLMSPRRGLDQRLLLKDAALGSIQTSMLFRWGDENPFGDADTARTLSAAYPPATLKLLPRAGHAP